LGVTRFYVFRERSKVARDTRSSLYRTEVRALPAGALTWLDELSVHALFLGRLTAFAALDSSRSRFGLFASRVSRRLIGTLTACLPASYF
jgi:hypothetical protein